MTRNLANQDEIETKDNTSQAQYSESVIKSKE